MQILHSRCTQCREQQSCKAEQASIVYIGFWTRTGQLCVLLLMHIPGRELPPGKRRLTNLRSNRGCREVARRSGSLCPVAQPFSGRPVSIEAPSQINSTLFSGKTKKLPRNYQVLILSHLQADGIWIVPHTIKRLMACTAQCNTANRNVLTRIRRQGTSAEFTWLRSGQIYADQCIRGSIPHP